jgi:AraC-like DNA-binding protein
MDLAVPKSANFVGEPLAIRPNTFAELPRTRAIASHRIAGAFRELDISASLLDGSEWTALDVVSTEADVIAFELVNGIEGRRTHYNRKLVQRVRREHRVTVGEHAGFHDLFVPIGKVGGKWGMLVAGPFSLRRPTATVVRERWRWMTGRDARAADPEFMRYLATTLAVLTLDGPRLAWFTRSMQCLAEILAGDGDVERLSAEAAQIWLELRDARATERGWAAARAMLDEAVWREWQSPYRAEELAAFGLSGLPEHVLVCLTLTHQSDVDPVEDVIRRDGFQRACVELAKRRGELLCGRVQAHGVAFLLCEPNVARAKNALIATAERVASLAERHGLRLHSGASLAKAAPTLPTRYRAALSAAERALSGRKAVVFAEREGRATSRRHLRELRRELGRAASESPNALGPRFERYLESVALSSRYGIEAMRAELEAGVDEITTALHSSGALDARDLTELERGLEHAADDASTAYQLSAAFRQCVADIGLALARPTDARQDRNLARALAFIRDHFAEPLRLERVARVAGFAPGYFSKLFKKSERMTFREYLLRIRIERAKHVLATTDLAAERVGQLCGFHTRNRFYVAFRRYARVAPLEYRARQGRGRQGGGR